MIATYRLSKHLASFEFFNWLVMVQADGANEIVFDNNNIKTLKFTVENTMRRFSSIINPGPALAGLKYRYGSDKSKLDATASQLLVWFKSGRNFSRLKTVKAPVECKYTVTIRENVDGVKGRNSNRDAWIQFAKEIDAILIDDYSRQPIHLHDRIALYAGAKMNFGVCNGPIHLLSLTTYPVTMFVNSQSARNGQMRWGMQPDQKYPWMLSNQTMIWEEDCLDNLRRAL